MGLTIGRVLVIGCGNMAGAMLEGWCAGGVPAGDFTVFDPSPRALPHGVARLEALPDPGTPDTRFDAVLLGVKPQSLDEIVPLVEPLAGPSTLLLSILAGVRLDALAARFPHAGGWLRIMPNLSAAIGKSPVGLAGKGRALDETRRAALADFMAPLGLPEWVEEADFDLFTALAGSGPAFIYRVIAALAQGAGALGLERAQALRVATAMVEGAAALASSSPDDPGTLADKVASPGGTTRAGLDVLDQGEALGRLMEATLRAARDRSLAMAAEAGTGRPPTR